MTKPDHCHFQERWRDSFAGPVYPDCASSLVLSREIPLKYSSNLSDSTSFNYSENFHFDLDLRLFLYP